MNYLFTYYGKCIPINRSRKNTPVEPHAYLLEQVGEHKRWSKAFKNFRGKYDWCTTKESNVPAKFLAMALLL